MSLAGMEEDMSEMIKRIGLAMFAVGHADAHGPDIYDEQAEWWEECARAALDAIKTAGYVVVPKEPTEAMIAAACPDPVGIVTRTARAETFRRMVAAALTPEPVSEEENNGIRRMTGNP
jgi:hypothetical protein